LSSTFSDLVEYRQAVATAIEMLDLYPERMELFLAQPSSPIDVCLREVESCDLFVGIYARRYGFVPEGYSKSMTELEFDHAHSLGRPIFAFFLDSSHPWDEEFIDNEEDSHCLQNFKNRIDSLYTRTTFTTPEDLSLRVTVSLANYLRELSTDIQDEPIDELIETHVDSTVGPLPNQQRIHVKRVFNRIANQYGLSKIRRRFFDRNKDEKIFMLKEFYNRNAESIFSACNFTIDSGTLNLSTNFLNTIAKRLFGILVTSYIGRQNLDEPKEGQISISMTLDFARQHEEWISKERKIESFREYSRIFQDENISDDDVEAYMVQSDMSVEEFGDWWTNNRDTSDIDGWKRIARIASLEIDMYKRKAQLRPQIEDLMLQALVLLNGFTSEAIPDLKE
jgi:hypothetical protein